MLNRKEAPVPAELATTTFGPLDKYVAANDNEAGRHHQGGLTKTTDAPRILATEYPLHREEIERLQSLYGGRIATSVPHGHAGDSAGTVRPLSQDNGQYIGLTRNQPAEIRAGDFMQTFTGRQYWPCDPQPHEVFIEDIAHALSLQCRYAGHCIKFYSVAEHSMLIARHLAAKHAPEVALAGLLHDAPEAYCVDIPRPLKPYLTNYKDIEQKNWLAIAARFGLPPELPDEVHDADNRIIADELVNLVPMPWHERHNKPLGVTLRYWSPEKAEVEFLATFEALMAGRA